MAKSAAIAASTNGDNQIVAGVTGRRIVVIGYVLVASGTVNAKWTDGGSGTALSGAMHMVVNTVVKSGAVPPILGNPQGWFATSQGNDLTLNLSAGVEVDGHVLYELMP